MRRAASARSEQLTAEEMVVASDERLARVLEAQAARWDELTERNAITEAEARPSILEPVVGQQELVERMLSGSQAKTAFALRLNAEEMIKGALKSTGFLTLTVGDKMGDDFQQIFDAAEASRRINNLNRRILPYLFERAIIVTERHKNGAIHFHILGVLQGRPDIRSGFDFDAIKKRDYRSASPALRGLWGRLREILPEYGFGRAELTPVRKTGPAVASYVSKYIEKNVCNRLADDKHKKLVRYLGWNGSQLKPNGFAWASQKAIAWRAKARALGKLINIDTDDAGIRFDSMNRPCKEHTQASVALGPRWAHELTRLWRSTLGDDLQNGFTWGFKEREFLRAELVNLSGRWARQKESERYQFTEEKSEIRKKWPEYSPAQLRQPKNQSN